MMIIGVTIPSDGSHGLISPKGISFTISCILFGLYFVLRQKVTYRQLMLICAFLSSICFLLVWFLIGIRNNELGMSSAIDQMKLFILTISILFMTLYAVSEGMTSGEQILRILIIANFLYSLTKVVLVSLHLIGAVNMFSLLHVTGIRFMTMGIIGSISRLQTSVDIITPFLLFFVLQSKPLHLRFGKYFRWAFLFISAFAIFLSFSRFLLFATVAACLLYAISLQISRMFKFLLLALALGLFAVVAIGFDNAAAIMEQRFFSTVNYYSDVARHEQISALMGEFDQYPLQGKGLGGYIKGLVRDGDILHSYEVQWVAFLMQFGIIGLFILFIPLAIISYRFLCRKLTPVRIGFLGMFLLWILSGFTNPFLISLTSGIIYSVFLLAADLIDKVRVSEQSTDLVCNIYR